MQFKLFTIITALFAVSVQSLAIRQTNLNGALTAILNELTTLEGDVSNLKLAGLLAALPTITSILNDVNGLVDDAVNIVNDLTPPLSDQLPVCDIITQIDNAQKQIISDISADLGILGVIAQPVLTLLNSVTSAISGLANDLKVFTPTCS